MTRSAALTLAFLLVLALGVVGCGSSENEAEKQSITVLAADSLKGPFTDIGERFKADNPGATVEFSFGNSADQVLQLVKGTRADVFASGDRTDMVKAEQAELVDGKPVDIAGQSASIAVLKVAPHRDLAQKFVDLVTAKYGQQKLSEAGSPGP